MLEIADMLPDNLSGPDQRPWTKNRPPPVLSWLTGAALNAMVFPALEYVVPVILPEGLGLLGGDPKIGKSFLVLDLAIAIASGGNALGRIGCQQGDVLYLALEDSLARLQRRLRQLTPFNRPDLTRLCLATAAPRIDEGLIDQLNDWLKSAKKPRLVVIDVLRCVRPPADVGATLYSDDAAALQPLHSLSRQWPGVAFLVVHHLRKATADDVFDRFSGSFGLTGVADTLLVLARDGDGMALSMRSREAEEFKRVLTRDRLTGGWQISGDAVTLAATRDRQTILDTLASANGEILTAGQLARAIGRSSAVTSKLLAKLLAERVVECPKYGKYRLPVRRASGWNGGDGDE